MFNKIDDFLIEKVYQPVSNKTMDNYGKGPMWLSSMSTLVFLLLYVIDRSYFHGGLGIGGGVIFVALLFMHFGAFNEDKNSSFKNVATLNERRVNLIEKIFRAAATLFLLLDIVFSFILKDRIHSTLSISTHLCLQALFYFCACDKLPPAPPKKKEVLISPVPQNT